MRSPTLLILSILSKTKTKENYEVNMRMILGAIAVAVCMEGCNTVEHSALPEASVSGDIVRASGIQEVLRSEADCVRQVWRLFALVSEAARRDVGIDQCGRCMR